MIDDEEHDYPLIGTKHLNPIGANRELVRMSLRTLNDFEQANKLENPLKPKPPSKTRYEAYIKNDEVKAKTKGYYQNDPERQAVTRHSAAFQVEELQNILKINPTLKAYYAK